MKKKLYNIVKRICDILVSIVGIIILVPLYLLIGPMIKIETKGKVIYKQKRIGKDGKIIQIYKFRTMVENADKKIEQLPESLKKQYQEEYKIQDDPRITKVGKILRDTNLDEMPQMINVLKGEMSIIGTRPILKEELEKYEEEDRKRLLQSKPGISGYWQVNKEKCRNYEDRIQMELYYVKNKNLGIDIKIFLKTLKKYIIRKKHVEKEQF